MKELKKAVKIEVYKKCYSNSLLSEKSRVADPFHASAGPDPAFYFNADPDPALLQSDQDLQPWKKQFWGSGSGNAGSACFWASRNRIQ